MKRLIILLVIILLFSGCSKNTKGSDSDSQENTSVELVDYGDRNDEEIEFIKKGDMYYEEHNYVLALRFYLKGDYADCDNAVDCENRLTETALKKIQKNNKLGDYGLNDFTGQFISSQYFILSGDEGQYVKFTVDMRYETDYGYIEPHYWITIDDDYDDPFYLINFGDSCDNCDYYVEPNLDDLLADHPEYYDSEVEFSNNPFIKLSKYFTIYTSKDYEDGQHSVTLVGQAKYNLSNGKWVAEITGEDVN